MPLDHLCRALLLSLESLRSGGQGTLNSLVLEIFPVENGQAQSWFLVKMPRVGQPLAFCGSRLALQPFRGILCTDNHGPR